MRSSDDTIEVQLWIARAVNPFRFKAVAELEAGLGVGSRNGFIKQLAKVGLMVYEERMRREHGIGARIAGRLVAALSNRLSKAEACAVASASAPTGSAMVAMAASCAANSSSAGNRRTDSPAITGPLQPTGEIVPETPLPNDEARSPSRVTGSGPRRMLGGYAND